MRDVFLERLIPRMETNRSIFFLTADLGSPVLDTIRDRFRDRFVNVGIAEQNLINVACGLALEGHTVYAYAIAPFITMRCLEQVRVNLAIMSQLRPMNVNLIGVGVGCSYSLSGPTHQCMEDISIMRCMPNIEVLSPADYVQAGAFVDYTLAKCAPKYLRFDAKPLPAIYPEEGEIGINAGFSELRRGTRVCVLTTGYMTHVALEAEKELGEEGIRLGVVDIFRLDDLPDSLAGILRGYSSVITLEEAYIALNV